MKVFILCGGYGTRLDHEGTLIAKPMVRIGKDPILMHLIKSYHDQGFNDFVFCLGHKYKTIIDYFLVENKKYSKKIDSKKKFLEFTFNSKKLGFKGTLIYTGLKSGTGGRIKIAYKKLKLNEDFLMTYGDGLGDISIKKLIEFHYRKKSKVTLTAVRPKQRYGILKINKAIVTNFNNENQKADTYVNGGFFVIDKSAIKKIDNKKYIGNKNL
jgi:glucose-1-phosphate cytidylyltransferase